MQLSVSNQLGISQDFFPAYSINVGLNSEVSLILPPQLEQFVFFVECD